MRLVRVSSGPVGGRWIIEDKSRNIDDVFSEPKAPNTNHSIHRHMDNLFWEPNALDFEFSESVSTRDAPTFQLLGEMRVCF